MPPNIAAQASQAAAQGQQQYNNDQSQAAASQAQYGTYQGQADAANQQVNNYTNYMAGAGSGTNLYNTALTGAEQTAGYDPNQAAQATQVLSQDLGQQADYNNYMNTSASKWGMNAGAFTAANAAGQAQNNNDVNAASQQNAAWLAKLSAAQTGANQSAGLGVQGEGQTLAGYEAGYTQAANARDQAASMMNYYSAQAQQQGSLNSAEASAYASAQAAYAQASLTEQQYAHQAALWANTPTPSTPSSSGKKATTPTPNAAPAAAPSILSQANSAVDTAGKDIGNFVTNSIPKAFSNVPSPNGLSFGNLGNNLKIFGL